MDPLEPKLKQALKPQEPPEGFAERVIARVRGQGQVTGTLRQVPWWRGWSIRVRWRIALASGLGCLLLIVIGLSLRWQGERLKAEEERIRAEQVRAQLLLALKITSLKLNQVSELAVEETWRARAERQ